MDVLASRLAKDSNVKSKSTKKVKRLAKDDRNKDKTRSVPKVDSSKIGKIAKKQKAKNVITDIPSKKKQVIKDIIKSQNNENENLIKKVTNVKNKKSKAEDVKQKVKDIKKSLKGVISKSHKVGKKNTEVLKNKINLQSDVKPSLNVISTKKEPEIIKNKKNKSVQPELVSKVKQTEPEVKKSKKVKQVEPEVAKSKKVQRVEPEIVKSKKVKRVEPEIIKSKKVKRVEPEIVKSKKVKKIKPETVTNNKIEIIEPKISKSNLESNKKTKSNKKEIKKSKILKENILNNDKPAKTKNVVNEEKTDVLNQKKKLKLSKKLKSNNVKLIKVENNEEIKSIKSKKRKQEDVEKEDVQSPAQPTLTKKQVLPYVKALLKVAENDAKSKNSLFDSETLPILLSVSCIKVPKVVLHQMRITLPHCMLTDTDEVALFVKDLKKGRRRDYEDTVHHYEDLLQQHGCTRVKTIIPINQVKTEYRQFEMRRRLLNSHDYFLVDGRISGHMAHLLGKTFRLKRKLPTSIHIDKKDLKEEIDNALKKTSLEIHSTGNTSITQVATCSMNANQIAENIMAVVKHLGEHFPGGWNNIRSLSIKTPLGLAIPIYITLKNRNTVEVPVVNPKRPKAYQDVEGELSTFTKNVNVKVTADGTVDVHYLGGNESDNEDDEGEKEDENEEVSEETENKIKKGTIKETEDDDDEEDDDDQEENEDDEDDDDDEDGDDDDDEEDDDESDDE